MNSYEEKQEARRQRYLERAEKARQEYKALHEEAHKMAELIPFVAWVRYLNGNGIFAAKMVIEQFDSIK